MAFQVGLEMLHLSPQPNPARHAGDNRFGPEPTAQGFSTPTDVFWQRTPHAGTA